MKNARIADMIGVVMASVEGKKGDEEMVFTAVDGRQWMLYHQQDCCESVAIEDIAGDVHALVGAPLTVAREDTNQDAPERQNSCESVTWTFYNFATMLGHVTVRWLGESNGYYSESVDFVQVK